MAISGLPIENTKGDGQSGDFAFGGEWDATSQQVIQVASFDVLDNCTITDGVFSPNSPIGAALATYINKPTNTLQRMTFVWPYTDSTSTLMVGLCTPSSNTDIQDIFAGTNTGFVGIGYFNAALKMSKYGNNAPEMIPTDNPVAMGDVVQLEYFADTNLVSFSNLTDNTSLGNFDLGNYAEFSSSLSLFIYSKGVVAFDIDTNLTPFTQALSSVTLPENPDGKTYIVINADTNSILDGRLLKDSDFVTFYNNAQSIMVSRLYTDEQIIVIANTAIDNALEVGGSIYNAIQAAINP